MFRYPDLFKVGIAESGNHDNRSYEDDWAEKWQGLPVVAKDGSSNYDDQANQNHAHNLEGHLLLIHGLLDDNVPPTNTLLVVQALIEANNDFDLLLLPEARHGYGSGEAGMYVTRPGRKTVVSGKRVSVRLAPGGPRKHKQTKQKH